MKILYQKYINILKRIVLFFCNVLFAIGAQGQQITLIPASALTSLASQQAAGMIRGVNIAGAGMMQLQPSAGINTANGFLQSFPVQNIPGIGNVQVISALQPTTVQALQPPTPTVHLESADPKWQIVQTIQANGTATTSQQQHQQQSTQQNANSQQPGTSISNGEDGPKPHRRRVACTCPNCGDGER